MQFNSIGRSSNFAQAGKATADDTLKSFIASRRNAPDYGKIVKEGMENRSAEKKASMETQAQVHKAGMKAKSGIQAYKIEQSAKREYASAKRKAGALGLAGKMFGTIGTAGGDKPMEPYKGSKTRAELEGEITKFETEASEARAGIKDLEKPDFSTPSSTGGGSTQSSTGGGGGSAISGLTSTYTPPKAGKIYSQGEMETLAVQGGFDPKDAPLVARIAMGESSGNPTAFNGVGRDQSYGLMQINMLGEMGPERRAQFGISSNEQLNDPLTNMKAAHAIYKQQGWGAWGAFTNGSYAKF
tara:strand:- start:222 stop:1118 length:897 start_codon:yes stop_codon:yes gene_type:complete